jgi:hypothetical protein
MMISIIKQLQFEVSADIFRNIAIQYENIERKLEFSNNVIIFIEHEGRQKGEIVEKISYMEAEFTTMKESNTMEIPVGIKNQFPLIMSINIFSFIKKMHKIKRILIEKFIRVKKELKYIMRKQMYNGKSSPRELKRLQYLSELKEKVKADLYDCIGAYDYMNDMITQETNIIDYNRYWYSWYSNKHKKYANAIVDDFVKVTTQP